MIHYLSALGTSDGKGGKDNADVEFWAKVNISEVDGFVRCNHIGWNNYNEGGDLIKQVEDFKLFYGCFPKLHLGDRKYLTRENRRYLKHMEIRIVGKLLGWPPKDIFQDIINTRRIKNRIFAIMLRISSVRGRMVTI